MFNLFLKVENSSIGSTSTFEIPRNATIPSDNNTHKVSIGIINLKPEFEYESIPKKNTHAFIKAKVINESNYSRSNYEEFDTKYKKFFASNNL